MRGKVLIFNQKTKKGLIKDRNGNLYSFHIGEWLSRSPVKIGKEVYFEIPKEEAINIRTIKISFFKKKLEKIKKILFKPKTQRRKYEAKILKREFDRSI
jgi:hypothetical protein